MFKSKSDSRKELILFICMLMTTNNKISNRISSSGVVLYGMMTGRLPFLSPCDEQTSSEERRRRLMAQINRGLTALQMKNMSRMSNDCKNLINRLLTPVPHKRITIQELCHHPWIVCKLRNVSRIASEADLDVNDQKTVIHFFRFFI